MWKMQTGLSEKDKLRRDQSADPIIIGQEDKFHYEITDACIMCGSCEQECPVHAIAQREGKYKIDPNVCIDCGTCSAVCPADAARRTLYIRASISPGQIDMKKCYFNPGCALSLYRPDVTGVFDHCTRK